jgi:hypothetical protein
MKIYQLLKIGEHHTNHCEDFAVVESLGGQRIMCAVMDGCTMGTDSYFIATLVGKLLRKIAIEKSYTAFYNAHEAKSEETDLKEILEKLMLDLKQQKNQLHLNPDELLCTLILLVVDFDRNAGHVMVIGDGLVAINGQWIEYDQDNRPDYLGYHIGEEFETWYKNQKQYLAIDKIDDISICTDGIFTFTRHDKNSYTLEKDPIAYLTIDQEGKEMDNMLSRKFSVLEKECGMRPADDLGIVRIINSKE